ncbi:MAG TPA: hypothetical protein PLP21_02665 [Pyrinomonadaceae bacterium]|nr:hypothetical protein [Acidobacteriota bacterium]HQZ95188.1 hypothetical protein [Pyrinomonadaceae bacterium]
MLAVVGSLIAFIGAIWLIVTAVQTGQTTGDKVLWGLVNFFCQPLGGIVFYIVKKQGLIPLLMVIGGWILIVVGGGANFSMGNLPN